MNDVLLPVFMQLPFNPLLIAAADQMKKWGHCAPEPKPASNQPLSAK